MKIITYRKVCSLLIVAIVFLAYGLSLSQLEKKRQTDLHGQASSTMANLPPFALKAVSGEFKGIVANMLLLQAGARIGTKVEKDGKGGYVKTEGYNCDEIYKLLKSSQTLDPRFRQTFIYANAILPWECDLVDESVDMLWLAKEHLPEDWMPVSLLSFSYYYFLNDYVRAGEILLNAAEEMKNPPEYMAILGARLIKKGGQTQSGIILLKSVLTTMEPDEPGYQDIQDRLSALQATLILEKAVAAYKQQFAKFPENAEQLLEKGVLSTLPDNPYELEFCIDQEGRVFFDRPDCRERKY